MKLYVEMTEEEYEKYKELSNKKNKQLSEIAQKLELLIKDMDVDKFLRNKGFVIKDNNVFYDKDTEEKNISVIYVKDNFKVTVEAKYGEKI